jgi:hypothetical protein
MTPQDIITSARYIINDTSTSSPRQSDTELLAYVNDGLRETVILRPELYFTVGDYLCITGQCEQTVSFVDAVALVEVLCIHGGRAITAFDFMSMSTFNPGWRTDTAGDATQYVKFANDPLKFFIYPQAPATTQILDVRYVRNPTVVGLTDGIYDLPVTYQPALVDYLVYRAESKDSESVLSQRAGAFQQSFVAKMKG